MSFRDILAPVISLAHDEAALAAAETVAARFEAHATALIVAVHLASEFSPHNAAFSDVLVDVFAGAKSHVARERKKVTDWLERASVRFETRDVRVEDALNQQLVLAHARRTDLIVLSRPEQNERAHDLLFQHILFGAGRPLLLVPERMREGMAWDRILIAWNGSREAARAVADALPFLKQAHEVVVATVDATPSHGGHGQAPGRGLGAYLARHDVRVEVNNIDGLGRGEAAALMDAARAMDANMLVMGGYGHSRARELVFGGVTRALAEAPALPLLISH
jgi:nucleotide-binding universal stress UspA family protein